MIMGQIEPDLLTENLDKEWDEKYKNETSEEKDARRERYRKAFVEYNDRFEEYKKIRRAESIKYKIDLFAWIARQAEKKHPQFVVQNRKDRKPIQPKMRSVQELAALSEHDLENVENAWDRYADKTGDWYARKIGEAAENEQRRKDGLETFFKFAETGMKVAELIGTLRGPSTRNDNQGARNLVKWTPFFGPRDMLTEGGVCCR